MHVHVWNRALVTFQLGAHWLAKSRWLTEAFQKIAAVRFDLLEIPMVHVHFSSTERIIFVFSPFPSDSENEKA